MFSDLNNIQQYKRRNPYDEYGENDLITVYLRSDVEKKAIQVWGSLENLNKEKEKRKDEIENKRRYLFNLKKTIRSYNNRLEQIEIEKVKFLHIFFLNLNIWPLNHNYL